MVSRRFAVYARQSIDKADSISIETQIERCLFEVGEQPYQIYSDRGYSGKNTDRPQFQQMLEAVRCGEICCVVCYKLDRCSRSILDFSQLMNLFQQYDVAFISCTEKFDTTTPMGRAMLNICVVFAQLERETIQQRITDAYHSRCKKGYFMGGRVPFGYSLVPCYLEEKKTSCYQTVAEEAEILKRIYLIYQSPNASLADVVLELKELNITNPRRTDGRWVRPHIARMIKNPIYVMADEQIYDYFVQLGTVADNPREDYIGFNGCYLYNIDHEKHLVLAPHQGIIPPDIWLRCQKRKQKDQNSKRSRVQTSWLTGKLICQKCGCAVIVRQTVGKNGRIYRYFICASSRGSDHLCDGFKAFPVHKTEVAISQAIIQHVKELMRDGEKGSDSTAIFKEVLARMENQVEASPEQMMQLFHLLDMRLQAETAGNMKHYPDVQKLTEPVLRYLSRWDEILPEKKAQIAHLLIEAAKLSNGKITIVWRC